MNVTCQGQQQVADDIMYNHHWFLLQRNTPALVGAETIGLLEAAIPPLNITARAPCPKAGRKRLITTIFGVLGKNGSVCGQGLQQS